MFIGEKYSKEIYESNHQERVLKHQSLVYGIDYTILSK